MQGYPALLTSTESLTLLTSTESLTLLTSTEYLTLLTSAGFPDESNGLQTVCEDVCLALVQLNIDRSVDRLLAQSHHTL